MARASQADCTDFIADAPPVAFDGEVLEFSTTNGTYATGVDGKDTGTTWDTNDTVTYKFDVELQNDPLAQGATTGIHRFIWEARDA